MNGQTYYPPSAPSSLARGAENELIGAKETLARNQLILPDDPIHAKFNDLILEVQNRLALK